VKERDSRLNNFSELAESMLSPKDNLKIERGIINMIKNQNRKRELEKSLKKHRIKSGHVKQLQGIEYLRTP